MASAAATNNASKNLRVVGWELISSVLLAVLKRPQLGHMKHHIPSAIWAPRLTLAASLGFFSTGYSQIASQLAKQVKAT